jgi:hypothetical protein
MASLTSDEQSIAISTDASNITEFSSLFRMSGENPQSPDGMHEDSTDDVDDAYKGINWSKLEGYTMAPHSKRQHISWTWEHRYRVQNMNSQVIFWLCKICIRRKANRNMMYNIAGGSHLQIRHLQDKHNLMRTALFKGSGALILTATPRQQGRSSKLLSISEYPTSVLSGSRRPYYAR